MDHMEISAKFISAVCIMNCLTLTYASQKLTFLTGVPYAELGYPGLMAFYLIMFLCILPVVKWSTRRLGLNLMAKLVFLLSIAAMYLNYEAAIS